MMGRSVDRWPDEGALVMKIFGTKRAEPTDEDVAASTRLRAVAARFKPQPLEREPVTEEFPEQVAQ
jgi:hypothetical protein